MPDYYPAEYEDIVDGSKDEGGALTIYSNTDQENWAPIFRDFQKKFPWVKTITRTTSTATRCSNASYRAGHRHQPGRHPRL